MKILFTIVILIWATPSFAQRVLSSCDAPDSIKPLYLDDIALQALIYEGNIVGQPYSDSIEISQLYQNYFARIFYAVYNAKDLPARDTVLQYNIHDYARSTLHKILFTFDTTVEWGKNFSRRIFPTGNIGLDSIFKKYSISVDSIWFDHPYGGSAILHTLAPLNTYPVMLSIDHIVKPFRVAVKNIFRFF